MFACLLGEEFSLGSLLTRFQRVERVEAGHFLVEYTGYERLPATQEGRIGIGGNRFLAECAARLVPAGGSHSVESQAKVFLASLKVDWLPAGTETLRRLGLLGIETMGQLVDLGRDALYRQFGAEGMLLWELASGIDQRPLRPTSLLERIQEEYDFDTPCSGGEWLAQVLRELVARLFDRLTGFLCLSLQVKLELEDGGPITLSVPFSMGTSRPEMAIKHLLRNIDSLQLLAPITTVTLAVERWAKRVAGELSLFAPQRARHLPMLKERLRAKGNPMALMRLCWWDRHCRIPERRAYLQSLLDSQVKRTLYQPRQMCVTAPKGEPVTVGKHAVSSTLDRWRLVDEWWTRSPIRRRYFRVALANGAHLRLFAERGQWFRQ